MSERVRGTRAEERDLDRRGDIPSGNSESKGAGNAQGTNETTGSIFPSYRWREAGGRVQLGLQCNFRGIVGVPVGNPLLCMQCNCCHISVQDDHSDC